MIPSDEQKNGRGHINSLHDDGSEIEMGKAVINSYNILPYGYSLSMVITAGGWMEITMTDDMGGIHQVKPSSDIRPYTDDINELTALAISLKSAATNAAIDEIERVRLAK